MTRRNDNAPKTFREVPCNRCGKDFTPTGPCTKRCDPCKIEHKREYEREKKRASHVRKAACIRCGDPFETEVHAHKRYCVQCAQAVRNEMSVAAYAADTERGRATGRRSYEKNKSYRLAKRKSPSGRAAIAAAIRKRRKDPGYRLHCNISRLINFGLKGQKSGQKWQYLVGYTIDNLKRHLERQFTKGMTWENYGKWHVDHIQPRASFTFSDASDPDFNACWALTNLQPLWATDNLKKSGRRSTLI